jgi:hypothetical protein
MGTLQEEQHLTPRAALFVFLLLAAACSSSRQSRDDADAGDTESISETETAFVTDEPLQLGSSKACWGVTTALNGGMLAVSWADLFGEDFSATEEMVVMPWLDPGQTTHAPSLYPGSNITPFRQILPLDGGMLSLSLSWSVPAASGAISQAGWNYNAVLVDGPHAHVFHEGFFPGSVSGQEPVDDGGRVLVATLSSSTEQVELGDETILFALDRFGPEGFREAVVSEVFDWSEQAQIAGSGVGCPILPYGATIEENGIVSAFNVSRYGSIVFAQASIAGEILETPRVIAEPPDEYGGPVAARQTKGASFAKVGDSVLGVVQLYGNFGTHSERRYLTVFDLDGNLLAEPKDLEPLAGGNMNDTVINGNDIALWNERLSYCFYAGTEDTYYVISIDFHGFVIGEPIPLISNATNGSNPFCAIEVVDEATLAVVVAVNSNIPDSGLNGPYLIVVTDPGLQ